MDVACGDAEDEAGYAVIGEVEGSGIGATAAADGDLEGDVVLGGGVDGESGEAGIADGGGVEHADLHAFTELALAFLEAEAGGVIGGWALEDDGDVWFHEGGEGFRTAEADFFLDAAGKMSSFGWSVVARWWADWMTAAMPTRLSKAFAM